MGPRLGFHPALLTVRLLLQVASLCALAYGARELAPDGPARFVAVLVVPLLAAVAWGLFGTPGDAAGRPGRPPVPVPGRVRLLLEALVLFGGAVLLAVSGQGWWAVALTGALVAYHVAAWDRVRWLLLPAAGPRRPNATDPTAR